MNINIDGLIKVNRGFSRESSTNTSLPLKAEVHVEEGHESLQPVHQGCSADHILLAACLLRGVCQCRLLRYVTAQTAAEAMKQEARNVPKDQLGFPPLLLSQHNCYF